MEEEARVIAVEGENATVIVEPHEGCVACPLARMCHLEGQKRYLEVINNKGAKPGDVVIIKQRPRTAITAALLVFAMPVVVFCLGYLLGNIFFPSQGIPIIISFVLLIMYFFMLKKIDKKYMPMVQ